MKKKFYFIFIILFGVIAIASCQSQSGTVNNNSGDVNDKGNTNNQGGDVNNQGETNNNQHGTVDKIALEKLNEASSIYDEKYKNCDMTAYIDITSSVDTIGSSMVMKAKNDLSFYSMKVLSQEIGYFIMYNRCYAYNIDYSQSKPVVRTNETTNIDMKELYDSLNTEVDFDSSFLDSVSVTNDVYSIVFKYNGSSILENEYYDIIKDYANLTDLTKLSLEMQMDLSFDMSGKVHTNITCKVKNTTVIESNISVFINMTIISKNFNVDYSFLSKSNKYDNKFVTVINNGEYKFGDKSPLYYSGADCYATVTFEKGYYLFTDGSDFSNLSYTISNNDSVVTSGITTDFYHYSYTKNIFKIENAGTYLVNVHKTSYGSLSSGYQIIKLNYEDSFDVTKELKSEINGILEGSYDFEKYEMDSLTKEIKIIKNTGDTTIRVGLTEYKGMTNIYTLKPNESMLFTVNTGKNTIYVIGDKYSLVNQRYSYSVSISDVDTSKGRTTEAYITNTISNDYYFVGFGLSEIAFKIVCEEDGYYKFKSSPSALTTYNYEYEFQYYTDDGKKEGRDYYYLTKGEHIIYATHNSQIASYAKVYYEYSKEINPKYQYY